MFTSSIILTTIVFASIIFYYNLSNIMQATLHARYKKSLESGNQALAKKRGEAYYTAIKSSELSPFDYNLIEEDIACKSMSDQHSVIINSRKLELEDCSTISNKSNYMTVSKNMGRTSFFNNYQPLTKLRITNHK